MKNRRAYTLVPTLLALVLMLAVSVLFGSAAAPSRVHITIIGTTDLHGNILPIDYYTAKPDARGLAKAATIIKRARKENPNLLLLDSGDTIQGTPLEYYHNKRNNVPVDPMMLVMNELHYDAMTVGNHEYNFGLKVLEKARGEAKFPWLSANTAECYTPATRVRLANVGSDKTQKSRTPDLHQRTRSARCGVRP